MTRNFLSERFYSLIGKMMPEKCIMKWYDGDNYYKWNLSPQVEMSVINKLNLVNKGELKGKCWSLQTRIWLLDCGVFTLVSTITTQDELMALLKNPKEVPTPVFITAVRRVTPSKNLLKRMVRELDDFQLLALADSVPGAFNDLAICDLFAGLESEVCREIKLMTLLLKHDPKRWSMPIVRMVADTKYELLKIEGMSELFELAVRYAVDVGENLSDIVVYLYNEYQKLYTYVAAKANNFVDIALTLVKADAEPSVALVLSDSVYSSCISELCKHLNRWDVFMTVYNCLKSSSIVCKCGWPLHNSTFDALCRSVLSYKDWDRLYHLKKNDALATELEASVVRVLKDRESALYFCKFFPFANWHNDKAVKFVCSKLVEYSVFPVDKIGLLSEDLVNFVSERMLTRSQILGIVANQGEGALELLERDKTKLTPDAECFIFETNLTHEFRMSYIERYGLSPKAFESLLSFPVGVFQNSSDRKYQLLYCYASNFGLSNKEYAKIMQSEMADKAMFLRSFVKNDKN